MPAGASHVTSVPAPGSSNLYKLVYDSRGFVTTNLGGNAAAAIGMVELAGRKLNQRLLVLGSGYACLEDNPDSFMCQRS